MNKSKNHKPDKNKNAETLKFGTLRYLGYFPYQSILKKMNLQSYIESLEPYYYREKPECLYTSICALIYSFIIASGEDFKTIPKVIPRLFEGSDFQENQIEDEIISQICDILQFLDHFGKEITDHFTKELDKQFSMELSNTCLTYAFFDVVDAFGDDEDYDYIPPTHVYYSVLTDSNDIPAGLYFEEAENYWENSVSDRLFNNENLYFKNRDFNGRKIGNIQRQESEYENIMTFPPDIHKYDVAYPWSMVEPVEETPCYPADTEWITGSIVICYMAYALQKVFQHKILKDEFTPDEIAQFNLDFEFGVDRNGSWTSLAAPSKLLDYLAKNYSLPVTSVHPTDDEIEQILNFDPQVA